MFHGAAPEGPIQTAMVLLGGLAIFLFGMALGGEFLQKTAGRRLRRALARLTDNRLMGVGVGTVLTFLTNSSSATSVILVGFVGAGLVTVLQATGVIMGASIGTAVTVQLIAFNLADQALWLIAGGLVLRNLHRRGNLGVLGNLVVAFGFIFLGMGLMRDAVEPLRSDPAFVGLLDRFEGHPWLAGLAGLVFTGVLQSSGATIGMLIAFSASGDISLRVAIGYVLGANVGTCITALLASLGAAREGKQVALIQLVFKLLGSLAAMLLLDELTEVTRMATLGTLQGYGTHLAAPSTPRDIANAHMIFNVANTLVFLPLAGPLAALAQRVLPTRPEQEAYFRPRYLDERVLDTPELAIEAARRETLRMAEVVELMLRDAIDCFTHDDDLLSERIRRRDDRVDLLQTEIIGYLTHLGRESVTQESSARAVALVNVVTDLENIGDVIVKNLMENAEKKTGGGVHFSPEGLDEIIGFHTRVLSNYRRAAELLEHEEIDRGLVPDPKAMDLLLEEDRLRRKHIERLAGGLRASIDTSAIHLDVLVNLLRINSHILSICRHTLGSDRYREQHG